MNLLKERLKEQNRLREEAARAGLLSHQDDLLHKSNSNREDSGSNSFTELSTKTTTNTLPKMKPLTEDRLCECDELTHCIEVIGHIMYMQWHRKQFLNGGGALVFLMEKSTAIYLSIHSAA